MPMLKKRIMLVVLLLVAVLAACREENSGQETAAGAVPATVGDGTAVSNPPTPAITAPDSGLAGMLAYLPAAWADFNEPVAFGPAIHFVDVQQVREAAGIGPVTGASEAAEKRELTIQLGLNLQGIAFAPDAIQPAAGSAFGEWGWDIADVEQLLYLPDRGLAIYKGDFGRPEIVSQLQDKGYTAESVAEFTLYTSRGASPAFALRLDLLIAGEALDVADSARFIASNDSRLAGHPAVQAVLSHLDGVWGAVLAPSPDLVGYSARVEQQMAAMDESMREILETRFPRAEPKPVSWNFMAIGFAGAETSNLTIVYHYPSNEAAETAVPVVERFLTEMPSFNSPGSTWGDLMMVQEVRVVDSAVIATAQTDIRGLIGNAFTERDFFAFLPVAE